MSRIKYRNLTPLLLLMIIITLLFAKVLFPSSGEIIYGGDILSQFYFWKGFLAHNLKQGIIPFWNPYNFSGTPFLAHPSTAFFYPANVIFYILPLNLSFSWYLYFHFLIASIGMYLCGKVYGDKYSGITSFSIFVLSGFFSSRVYAGHIDILSTAVWIPWVFWSVLKFLNNPTKGRILLTVIFFCLEILAGYQAFVIFTLELIFIYLILHFIKNIKLSHFNIKKTLMLYFPIIIALILSLGITSIQWLPTAQLVSHSIRKEGLPYSLASWGSLPLSGIKLFITPFDAVQLAKLSYGFTEGSLPNFFDYYLGTIAMMLIFIVCLVLITVKIVPKIKQISSIFFHNNFDDFWQFIIIGIFFLYISFGYFVSPNLHAMLYRFMPAYRYFRIPDQHLVMVVFTAAVLCAIVIGNLRSRKLKILVTAALVIQLFYYSQRFFILTDLPDNRDNISSRLTQNKTFSRFLPLYRVDDPLKEVFEFNSAMTNEIFSVSGYDPIILYDYYHFINLTKKNKDTLAGIIQYNVEVPPIDYFSNPIRLLGIKYILSGLNIDPSKYRAESIETIDKTDRYLLSADKSVQNRFFILQTARSFANDLEVEDEILNEKFDLTKEVLITDPKLNYPKQYSNKDCGIGDKNSIDIISYNPNSIELTVNSKCDGYLVTSEVYYPGWRAQVDGNQTPIYKSNIAFRSIYLEKGSHLVKFYYFPFVYYSGAIISLISILLTGLYIVKTDHPPPKD